MSRLTGGCDQQDEDFQPFDYGLLLDKARKGQYATALTGLTAAEDQLKAAISTNSSRPQTSASPATGNSDPVSRPAAVLTSSSSRSSDATAPGGASTHAQSHADADARVRQNASAAQPAAASAATAAAPEAAEDSSSGSGFQAPSSSAGSQQQREPSSPAASTLAPEPDGLGAEQAEEEQPWRHWHMEDAAVQEGLLQRLRLRRSLMQVGPDMQLQPVGLPSYQC